MLTLRGATRRTAFPIGKFPAVADAPLVAYPTGRSGALATVVAGLVCSGWLAALWVYFWAPALVHQAPVAILLILSCLASAGAAWHFWRRQIARTLRWDGAHWFLSTAVPPLELGGEGAQVQVRLDAQRWMLLWFRAAGDRRGQWLWVQARSEPPRWHLLRCALYLPVTSANTGGLSGADTERA